MWGSVPCPVPGAFASVLGASPPCSPALAVATAFRLPVPRSACRCPTDHPLEPVTPPAVVEDSGVNSDNDVEPPSKKRGVDAAPVASSTHAGEGEVSVVVVSVVV